MCDYLDRGCRSIRTNPTETGRPRRDPDPPTPRPNTRTSSLGWCSRGFNGMRSSAAKRLLNEALNEAFMALKGFQ